ncbi:MAG: HAD family hydrolase [Dehalococcoidia bacterium]
MSQITAVTFDLWQTLLLDNRELGRERAQLRLEGTQEALKRIGENYSIEHLREAYRACYRHCHRVREDNLDVSFQEQVDIFINFISPDLPDLVNRLPQETIQKITRTYSDAFFVYPPVPHDESVAVLEGIKDMGLKIGLISNTGMTPGTAFRRFLDQHNLLHYFHTLTFSDEVKLAKPSDQIFRLTVDSLHTTPEQTVHVGDHVINDVQGAKQVGMKTIWIEGFYEREDPTDPKTEPDIAVPDLGEVVSAVEKLRQLAERA